MSKLIDYTGVRYNKLVGIRFNKLVQKPQDPTRCDAEWLWQCDCGQQIVALARYVKRNFKKSCGCHVRRGWKMVAWNVYKKSYADGDLTFEDFCQMAQQNCYYCNKPPSNNRNYHNNQWTYNGLDRLNNTIHNKDNVVPCCWYCNQKKSNTDYEEFMNWISTVYHNRKENE